MDGWEILKLGSVCSLIKRGISPKYLDEGGICVINQKCIRDHIINYDVSRRHDLIAKKVSDERYIQLGDVLVNSTGTGTLGRLAQVRSLPDEPVTVDTHVTIVRPKPMIFYNDFFGYMMIKIEAEISKAGEGASGQTELARTKLENDFLVSFPKSIEEQKRIVAILDQAFAQIDQAKANAEKNLHNAHALFESTCSISIFSTDAIPSCTVLDVAKNEKGAMRTGPFGSQLLKREIVDSGIAVLGIDNAVKNSFQWGAKRFITPEKFEELSRFEVKPGDVLITIMGTCGRCAIVPENIPKAINTKHICCISLDREKCLPEYLHAYFLYHPLAQEYLLSRAKGAIMAGLNMGIIKELPLVLPCIEEQKRLVSQVNLLKDNIDKLVMTYEAKLVALDELKKSLLHKAFTGELTKSEGSAA